MKNAERDGLILMLAMASGSADGWSYFGIAHSFVANMTGNTVLLGISIFYLHGDALHPLIGIAGYVAGVLVGTLICRDVAEGVTWARPVSWALFLESLLLLAAEAAWVAMHQQPSPTSSSILLACVALAIGIQSAAMFQLKIPGVVTTYITGTWTTLTNGLTLLAARQPRIVREIRPPGRRSGRLFPLRPGHRMGLPPCPGGHRRYLRRRRPPGRRLQRSAQLINIVFPASASF